MLDLFYVGCLGHLHDDDCNVLFMARYLGRVLARTDHKLVALIPLALLSICVSL